MTGPLVRDRLVLCYHAVSNDWHATLAVKPERLVEQVAYLKGRGYRARTFSDAIFRPDRERSVAITFDDAYRSVFELAYPLLRELGVTATVFVPTRLVGTDEPMSWPGVERWVGGPHASEMIGMSWAELSELADAGWEVGSHSRTHARLTTLGDESLALELAGSRADCEAQLGRPCRVLAYPYGAIDARVVRAAMDAGYVAAAAPPNHLQEERCLRWPRVGVYPADDLRRFRLKVSPTVRRLRESRAWTPIALLSALGRS